MNTIKPENLNKPVFIGLSMREAWDRPEEAKLKQDHITALQYDAWRDGKANDINDWEPIVLLRVKDGYIETTQSAKVTLQSAEILYRLIKDGRDVKGHNIDGYTVISLNGELTIGCHKIPLSEVDRMAVQLGWK